MTDKAELLTEAEFLTDEGILSVADTCPLEGFDSEMIQFARAIEAAILRKLAEQEPVAIFKGRRLTPEGTSEFWGTLLCGSADDLARDAYLYAAPVPKE